MDAARILRADIRNAAPRSRILRGDRLSRREDNYQAVQTALGSITRATERNPKRNTCSSDLQQRNDVGVSTAPIVGHFASARTNMADPRNGSTAKSAGGTWETPRDRRRQRQTEQGTRKRDEDTVPSSQRLRDYFPLRPPPLDTAHSGGRLPEISPRRLSFLDSSRLPCSSLALFRTALPRRRHNRP